MPVRALGHDVWSGGLGHMGLRSREGGAERRLAHNVSYLERIMRVFDRRSLDHQTEADGKYYGMTDEKMAEKTIAEARSGNVVPAGFDRSLLESRRLASWRSDVYPSA
jgi:hypothetical protein